LRDRDSHNLQIDDWSAAQSMDLLLQAWPTTLPNTAAVATAQLIQTHGPVLAPTAACTTGLWAILRAYELIETGQCERVLAGAVETPVTPLTLAGFGQMGVLAPTGAYPFDQEREGLVLGEGGGILVLESCRLAEQRQAQVYGQILGGGCSADAYHYTTPLPEGEGGQRAIQQALAQAGLGSTVIDYIHAHGTATQLNDQTEARLIQKLFGRRPAVSSTKGATGHTLGAAGALGAAFCLLALSSQTLPPCVGLQQPAFDLQFVDQPQHQGIQTALCLSFGFGGQNAALVMGRG
jgi:3-oxoacyl-[acyl-carrier-protein] synthase II